MSRRLGPVLEDAISREVRVTRDLMIQSHLILHQQADSLAQHENCCGRGQHRMSIFKSSKHVLARGKLFSTRRRGLTRTMSLETSCAELRAQMAPLYRQSSSQVREKSQPCVSGVLKTPKREDRDVRCPATVARKGINKSKSCDEAKSLGGVGKDEKSQSTRRYRNGVLR